MTQITGQAFTNAQILAGNIPTTTGNGNPMAVALDEVGRVRVLIRDRQISSPLVYQQTTAFTATGLGLTPANNTNGVLTTAGVFTAAGLTYANCKVGQKLNITSGTSQTGTDGSATVSAGIATTTSASMTYANLKVGQTIAITGVNTPSSTFGVKVTQTSTTSVATLVAPYGTMLANQLVVITGSVTPETITDTDLTRVAGTNTMILTSATMTFANARVGKPIVISGAAAANNGTFYVSKVNAASLEYVNSIGITDVASTITCKLLGNNGTFTLTAADATSATWTNALGYTETEGMTLVARGNTGSYVITEQNAGNIKWNAPYGITESSLVWTTTGNTGSYAITTVGTSSLTVSPVFPVANISETWALLGTADSVGSISKSGSTITFTSTKLDYAKCSVGRLIVVSGASNSGNNGTFAITAVNAGNIQFTNASGVNESTITYVIAYEYKTVSELIQPFGLSTSQAYSEQFCRQICSNAGGTVALKFVDSTADSSAPQTFTLSPGKDYNWLVSKIYLPTTATASLNTITDLTITV